MALALIHFEGRDGENLLFQCDIGTNRFYEYAIGGAARTVYNSVEWLNDVVYQSDLQENKSPMPLSGRFRLQIPVSRMPPGADFIQLYSYKTSKHSGQAASEIIPVSTNLRNRSDLEVPAMSHTAAYYPLKSMTTINVPHRLIPKDQHSRRTFGQYRHIPGAAFSKSKAQNEPAPVFRRLDLLKIRFADDLVVQDSEPEKLFFSKSAVQWEFPLEIEIPHPVNGVSMAMLVKETETMQSIVWEEWTLPVLENGSTSKCPAIHFKDFERFSAGKVYQMSVYLTWKNKQNEKVGAENTQMFQVAESYIFMRLDDAEPETIPLNDVEKHRDYWHKIWAGSAPEDISSLIFKTRYVFAADREAAQNGRLETSAKQDENLSDGDRLAYELNSGLLLSISALNRLLPMLDRTALPETAVAALRSGDFVDRLCLEASTALRFDGLKGDEMLAIWGYPELRLRKIWFKKALPSSSTGKTTAFEDVAFLFPFPVSFHFIGLKSKA